MNSRKPKTTKPGILPKLKGFLNALGDRYQKALQVIDEALASDNFKDQIWAVDWILKRMPSPDESANKKDGKRKKAETGILETKEQLARLNETELLKRIRDHLGDSAPNAPKSTED